MSGALCSPLPNGQSVHTLPLKRIKGVATYQAYRSPQREVLPQCQVELCHKKATGVNKKLPKVSLKTGAGHCVSNPLENMLCTLRRGSQSSWQSLLYPSVWAHPMFVLWRESGQGGSVGAAPQEVHTHFPHPRTQRFPFLHGVQKGSVTVQ